MVNPAYPATRTQTPTVLLVDDEPDHLELMTMQLTLAGIKVVTAADSGAALEAIRGGRVSVAVVDAGRMGNGLRLLQAIQDSTEPIPVILVSADAWPENVDAGLAAGATAYLVKPFRQSELLSRVRTLLKVPT